MKVTNLGEAARLMTWRVPNGYITSAVTLDNQRELIREYHESWFAAVEFHDRIARRYRELEYEAARLRVFPQQSLDLGKL